MAIKTRLGAQRYNNRMNRIFETARKLIAARDAAIDQTPAGQQHVLPGAEKASDATIAQRRADALLRPKAIQRPCDAGLFGDGARQVDLF